ncbi:MAG: hypothetical protein RLZZ501_761 [Pseudomonadota bacterium]
MRSVRLPLVAAVLLVLLGSLGIGAVANSLFFHRFLVNASDSRLLAAAIDVRDVFARAASLGLPLAQFQGGEQVLAETRRADPALRRIVAFESAGDHFHTLALAGAAAGEDLPAGWARAIHRAPAASHWQIDDPDGFGVLVPIRSGFGATIGLIALVQSRAVLEQPQDTFDSFLLRQAGAVALPTMLALALLVGWLLRPLAARLPLWRAHLDALLAGRTEPPPPPRTGDLLDGLLRPALARLDGTAAPAEPPAEPLADAGPALRRLKARVVALTVAAIVIAATASGLAIARHQDEVLGEALLAKPLTVTALLARDVAHALDLGIPPDSLRGVDRLFADARAAHPEIAFLRLTGADGRILAEDGAVPADLAALAPPPPVGDDDPHPLRRGGFDLLTVAVESEGGGGGDAAPRHGAITLGVAQDYAGRLIKDRLIDIGTVGLVAVFVSLEILLLLLDQVLTGPLLTLQDWSAAVLRGERPYRAATGAGFGLAGLVRRAQAWGERRQDTPPPEERRAGRPPWPVALRSVRICLFLFVLSDALPLSVLPLYAAELYQPMAGLSREMLLAAPVMVYWLASALIHLPCSTWLDRLSYRVTFALGAALAALGGLGAAWAPDLPSLLAARALGGAGLGIIFTVAQAATTNLAPARHRAYAMAGFSSVFFLATFCGTALGGLIADEIGLRALFLVVAGQAVLAGLAAWPGFGRAREPRRPGADGGEAQAGWRDYLALAGNARYAGLLLLSALPNRMFNLALVFYLAPLCLFDAGLSKGEIARVVSVYGLVMALVAPIGARLADRFSWHVRLVMAGSLICGGAALIGLPLPASTAIAAAVVGMGIGQALSIPSQMSVLPVLATRQAEILGLPRVYAVFRMVERVPAFFGLIIAGGLAAWLGYGPTVAVWGAALVLSTLALIALFHLTAPRRRSRPCPP